MSPELANITIKIVGIAIKAQAMASRMVKCHTMITLRSLGSPTQKKNKTLQDGIIVETVLKNLKNLAAWQWHAAFVVAIAGGE